MSKSEYGLVYVNLVGIDINGIRTYELFFHDDVESVWGNDWSVQPIANTTTPEPDEEFLTVVRILRTDRVLIPAQMNSCFSYQDCKDKVYSILYEDINEYMEYPDVRLVFHYGDTLSYVIEKLLSVDLNLEEV